MTERLMPTNMSQDDLLHILDDIRDRVAAGDSYEGFLNFLLPDDENAPPGSYDVEARYRIGNLYGQGGMRIFGEWREESNGDGDAGNPGSNAGDTPGEGVDPGEAV